MLVFLLVERHTWSSCTFANGDFVRCMWLPSEMPNDGCHLMTTPLQPRACLESLAVAIHRALHNLLVVARTYSRLPWNSIEVETPG
jgi:hypothetical protein